MSWEGSEAAYTPTGLQLAERLEKLYLCTMSKQLASVLTTVNAPYSAQLDGAELAHCLSNFDLAKQFSGQVSSFFGEVPAAEQQAFAYEFGIALADLKSFASDFAKWSGQSYHLAS
ncbi:hypothetical protein ACFOEZ_20140 [Tianweitania populi]|uniref:Uncharacterized protein n=1 Tax=Tianweitania populi TaxID=1607949 RepID=A0A8J3GM13_9HYPH|nr:hypothetical protein [Tianweitania populi]GHD21133.1 hypothetical protein GCM10016234_34480 [Tianweitania populi]